MIRIGIVGCGRILAAHLAGFQLLAKHGKKDFAITALCARKHADAESYIRRGQGPPQRPACSQIPGDPLSLGDVYLSDFQDVSEVQIHTDYRRLAADDRVDAIIDLSTHAMHPLVAAEAFRHRKHLLTQKPMASTIRSARRMIQQSHEAKTIFGVFECFRFMPLTRALEWAFRTGRLGTLQMIYMGYVGVWWAPDRIVADTPWRHRRAEGGGITLDLGVHFFDQMRVVAGRPASIAGQTSVIERRRYRRSASGDVLEQVECDADDTAFATIEFTGGATAHLLASWAGHAQPMTIGSGSMYYGTAGCIDGEVVRFDDQFTDNLIEIYRREADADELARRFPLGIDDWFALAQLDWLEAIRQNASPEANAHEGLLDLAGSLAILESSAVGRRVSFDEVLSGELREYQKPTDDALGL